MFQCSWCNLNSQRADFLFETKHYRVYLSEDQSLLGRLIVVLKRHATTLSDLSAEEMLDFLNIVKVTESTLKDAFGATMFNWSCLMNNAYKQQPNPHVHWHCRPRYKQDVNFEGAVFSDPDFAHHYNNKRKRAINKETKHKIVEKIKATVTKYISY
ncbi:MAG: HIT family protein [Candidatus Heimdallarchaeaceae archaeon]